MSEPRIFHLFDNDFTWLNIPDFDNYVPIFLSFSTACYYIGDHLGTAQVLLNGQGVVVWQGNYRPFGEVDIVVNNLNNYFRFPGQIFDPESDLHYNWNRYYNPQTGRYISPDSIGLDGGLNLFAYVDGDPVNYMDLEGFKKIIVTSCQTPAGQVICSDPTINIIKGAIATTGAGLGSKAIVDTIDAVNTKAKEQCEDNFGCRKMHPNWPSCSELKNLGGYTHYDKIGAIHGLAKLIRKSYPLDFHCQAKGASARHGPAAGMGGMHYNCYYNEEERNPCGSVVSAPCCDSFDKESTRWRPVLRRDYFY